MSPANEGQNVWFGVAMFLLGLVVGIILTVVAGAGFNKTIGFKAAPTAPSADQPSAPAAPQVSVQDKMKAYAQDIGLNESTFSTCIGSTKYNDKINQEETEGGAAGVQGTPGNIIYSVTSKKGYLLPGAQPIANFKGIIDAVLQNPSSPSVPPNTTEAKQVIPVNTETDHLIGNKNAKVAIIVYTDYECPFCHRVHPTLQQLEQDYAGKIMVVYRHFPLSFHSDAMPLAIGAECAAELGGNDAFWKYTDKVMGG